MRSTEITLESSKHLINVNEENIIHFKLLPLFNDQKLDVKNCILEIEYMFNKMPPQNLLFQCCNVKFEGPDDEPFQL